VGVEAHLYRDGQPLTGLDDPSGGNFDAAGDFDRLIPAADLTVLSQVDSFGDLAMDPASMPALIAEVTSLLARARAGSEQHGLLRLRALAQACADTPGSALVFRGD
jgi:hypothetical protein